MTRAVPTIAYIEPTPPTPTPPSSHRPKSNLPTLSCGLIVVGTAAIVLAVYNLIIIKWCVRRQQQPRERQRPNNGFIEATTTAATSDQSFDNNNIMNRNLTLLSSFTYHKKEGDDNYEHECAVCLSVFEEGDEVRRLPRCKHSFHASCIDMWLYSHFDCPLCRAPVNQVTRYGLHLQVDHSHESQEHSREILLASGISRQIS